MHKTLSKTIHCQSLLTTPKLDERKIDYKLSASLVKDIIM